MTLTRGTVRSRVCERHLRAIADHAAPLEIFAGVEARCVDEGDERKIERVAHRDEPTRPFVMRAMSSVPASACGWLATTPTERPSIVAEAGDEVGRPARAAVRATSPSSMTVSDDVTHVVAAGRRIAGMMSPTSGAARVGGSSSPDRGGSSSRCAPASTTAASRSSIAAAAASATTMLATPEVGACIRAPPSIVRWSSAHP